jgi:hypothetical protein
MCKKQLEKDYGVMPLEGLFWTEDMKNFNPEEKDQWLWTLLIMQPEMVTETLFDSAIKQVETKKNPPALNKIRFEIFDEGRAAQVMYIGPYSEEGPAIQDLHAFIKNRGGVLNGAVKKHHEIYLGDSRRRDPAKLQTIIRQPY